jgi:glycosyltransferase involved in cell wall biosynthesis
VKVLLFANTDWFLYNFRMNLARSLRQRGLQVILLSPAGDYVAKIEAEGFLWLRFELSRSGMNVLKELKTIFQLASLYRSERPDLVHHYTIKCILYGSIAARLAGIKTIVNAVTGMGYVFTGAGLFRGLLRVIVQFWYWLVLKDTEVIFENSEDRQIFLNKGLVPVRSAHLIRGSGIDIARFQPSAEPPGEPLILLAARLLWDKGVGEFVEAARLVRRQGSPVRFILVGNTDSGNPSAISPSQLQSWVEEGVVEWWGWRDDIPEVLAAVHVVCLPSYREGLPTILTEAAASGRATIAADAPGCREAVRDGETGLLVPPRDPASLAQAIRTLIEDPDRRRRMGIAGRRMVEQEFSSAVIIGSTFRVYHLAGMKGMP